MITLYTGEARGREGGDRVRHANPEDEDASGQ